MTEPSAQDPPESTSKREGSKAIWIGAGVAVVVAVATALLAPSGAVIANNLAASSQDSMARIDHVAWVDRSNVVTLTGQAIGLDASETVWLFASREDGESGAFPADEKCTRDSDGMFSCTMGVGEDTEAGFTFVLTVAVVDTSQADAIRDKVSDAAAFDTRTAIPHVAGNWTTHEVEIVRR